MNSLAMSINSISIMIDVLPPDVLDDEVDDDDDEDDEDDASQPLSTSSSPPVLLLLRLMVSLADESSAGNMPYRYSLSRCTVLPITCGNEMTLLCASYCCCCVGTR